MESILTLVGLVAVLGAVVMYFKKQFIGAVRIILLGCAILSAVNAIYGSAVSEALRLAQIWVSWFIFIGFILLAIKVGDWMQTEGDSDVAKRESASN